MTVTEHPFAKNIKEFEVTISRDGAPDHVMRVRKGWFEGKEIDSEIQYQTTDGDIHIGKLKSVRPIREGA